MSQNAKTALSCLAAVCLAASLAQPAAAQRRGGARLFGVIPAPSLAQLSEVEGALEMTDAQKKSVADVVDELNDLRREAFQSAQGDFDRMRRELNKAYADMTAKLNGSLEESQQKRLHEIYLQVNGAVALADKDVAEALKLSDEQVKKLDEAATAAREELFSSFQDFQSMSDEEREKRVAELVESRDASHLAVLTDEQKKEFEKLKGEKLDVDLSALPGPGGR